jgi:2-methylcitrate dehydratase
MSTITENKRPKPDDILVAIADYVMDTTIDSELAYQTAGFCLMDALGCAMHALHEPECVKLLGPIVPDTIVLHGARVPGTDFVLDPVKASFDLGSMIRWHDFNDTWLAAEWGHPSDNIGALLPVADYISRVRLTEGHQPLRMYDVLTAIIKAYEIQGILALENSFNRMGLDHVILVKLASAALSAQLMGATKQQLIDTLSQVFVDGQSLRVYRHAPNVGSRKSWAAGDAASRGVRLAMMTLKGEPGYPGALTARGWGFYDVSFGGKPFHIPQPFGSYVIENILYKVSYPAEFHAQTAAEAAIMLHSELSGKIDQIERIEITTQEPAIRIISKKGPLYNPADRDHCIQYIVAIGLLYGYLHVEQYSDKVASDILIDQLREKMHVVEDPRYTFDYYDPSKRSIANAVQVFFQDGTSTEKIEIEYPLGHRRRRDEGIPQLIEKFEKNMHARFGEAQFLKIREMFHRLDKLEDMPVNEFVECFL